MSTIVRVSGEVVFARQHRPAPTSGGSPPRRGRSAAPAQCCHPSDLPPGLPRNHFAIPPVALGAVSGSRSAGSAGLQVRLGRGQCRLHRVRRHPHQPGNLRNRHTLRPAQPADLRPILQARRSVPPWPDPAKALQKAGRFSVLPRGSQLFSCRRQATPFRRSAPQGAEAHRGGYRRLRCRCTFADRRGSVQQGWTGVSGLTKRGTCRTLRNDDVEHEGKP